MKRCLNLDWLEVYCLENPELYPQNADYYRGLGYYIEQREYGTRVYDEMFTIYDEQMQPAIEVRRKPASVKFNAQKSVIDPYSCHIRLVNRYCYFHKASEIMAQFILASGLKFVNISRVDIALDIEKFDSGDEPSKFIRRYLEHKYSKINQSEIRAVGKDEWAGLSFNSLHWGSKNSPISTKFYNKTLEIKSHSVKGGKPYKPYIPQAWVKAGLIDSFTHMTKTKDDGSVYEPQIWRLEFTICSKVKGWVTMKNWQRRNTKDPKMISLRNDLAIYSDEKQLLNLFASLTKQYFFFRHYIEGKRKYDCEEKILFNFDSETDTLFKQDRPLTSTKTHSFYGRLIVLLEDYYSKCFENDTKEMVAKILRRLKESYEREYLDMPFNKGMQELIQLLMTDKYQVEKLSDEMKFLSMVASIDGRPF